MHDNIKMVATLQISSVYFNKIMSLTMSRWENMARQKKQSQLFGIALWYWLTAIFLIIKEFAKNIWGDAELNQQSFGLKVVSISSAMNGAMPAIMWCITGELKRANVQIKKLVVGHVGKLVLFIFGDVCRGPGIQVR